MAQTNNVFGEGADRMMTRFKMHAAKIIAFQVDKVILGNKLHFLQALRERKRKAFERQY